MILDEITYADLFAFLEEIGFHDSSKSDFERVFAHPESGIVLVFAMMDDSATDRLVRGADITSAQVRLQEHGLLAGKIQAAVQRARDVNG